MFLSENSTPEREEEIYKILLFCIECDIKSDEIKSAVQYACHFYKHGVV